MPRKTAERANRAPVKAADASPEAPSHSAWSTFARSPWAYPVVSLLLLAPCVWQAHIQAGDLASHIYNAWLAQLIETRHLQGLTITGQSNNILFDLLLSGFLNALGADAAQRIAVSIAVLVFAWGVFAFAAAVSGRRPWQIMPVIAMLSYGWVFHMGFFNFYLSLGFCTWALALLWKPNPMRAGAAIVILIAAYVAHPLPVAWAVALVAYRFICDRVSPGLRRYVLFGSLLAMIAVSVIMNSTMTARWSAQQLTLTSGLDQVWVYDGKYFGVFVGMFLVWLSLFFHLMRSNGTREVVSTTVFQWCLLTAAVVFILPTSVLIPGYKHALVFIAERMSLAVGICVCALFAQLPIRRVEQFAILLVTLLFFGFLYRDERALNSLEDRMRTAVLALPADQRVISAIDAPDLRVNALAHLIDRACIGHCYSYANYEPSTAQFRIRATAENPYVAYTYEDSWMMQVGLYVVKARDLPLYQVNVDSTGQLVLKSLPAGVRTGTTPLNVLDVAQALVPSHFQFARAVNSQ